MKTTYPDLELGYNRVNTPVDKQVKTPIDYIPNVVDAFKRINYYRKILVQKKPKRKLMYKDKMAKRFDITLRQGYVNKVAGMLNNGVIKNRKVFASGQQCGTLIATFQHIFECEEVKKYYSDLSTHL